MEVGPFRDNPRPGLVTPELVQNHSTHPSSGDAVKSTPVGFSASSKSPFAARSKAVFTRRKNLKPIPDFVTAPDTGWISLGYWECACVHASSSCNSLGHLRLTSTTITTRGAPNRHPAHNRSQRNTRSKVPGPSDIGFIQPTSMSRPQTQSLRRILCRRLHFYP